MSETDVVTIAEQPVSLSLAKQYGVDAEYFVRTVMAVAMPDKYSTGELVSCLLVAREHKLNPLTREIYFMRTKGGGVQPIVGVDGWIRKCNEHDEFDGMEFDYTDDSVTCRIFRKDRARPISITEFLDECKGTSEPWKRWPRRMLRHRALCQCARLAFGMAGIMEPDEFEQWQTDAIVIDAELAPKRKSSAEAKRDGTTDVFNEVKGHLEHAAARNVLNTVWTDYKDELATFPARWFGICQDAYLVQWRQLADDESEQLVEEREQEAVL